MKIKTSRLLLPEASSYQERIRRHQQSENKAESLVEHKRERAHNLPLVWDEENGVYSLGGRRLTWSCEVYEFDYEAAGEFAESRDRTSNTSQVTDEKDIV